MAPSSVDAGSCGCSTQWSIREWPSSTTILAYLAGPAQKRKRGSATGDFWIPLDRQMSTVAPE